MFLTSGARKAFTKLRQAFIEVSILNHFDLEHHIQIQIDISDYAIGEIFSQLTLDDLDWWNQMVFFSQKMIPVETWYKTHDSKLLAIIIGFKIWRHYLESYKHKVIVLTNYNNL